MHFAHTRASRFTFHDFYDSDCPRSEKSFRK